MPINLSSYIPDFLQSTYNKNTTGYDKGNDDVSDEAADGADAAVNNQDGTAAAKTKVNADAARLKMEKSGEDTSLTLI